MAITYWLIFFFLILKSFSFSYEKTKIISLRQRQFNWIQFFFIFLAIIIGFRFQIGGDWHSYLFFNEYIADKSLNTFLKINFDFGYVFLNWIGANIFGGIYLVNFVSALIFLVGLISFALRQNNYWLALVVAFPYLIIVISMGYSRQASAIGFILLAINQLKEANLIRFCFFIFLATLFHKTALLILPIGLMAILRNKSLLLITLFLLSFAVYFFADGFILGLLNNYLVGDMQSSGAGVRLLLNFIPALFYLYFFRKFNFSDSEKKFWIYISLMAVLIFILNFMFPQSPALDRVSLYFLPIQILVWSNLPFILGPISNQSIIITICVSLLYLSILFVWINFASHSSYWLPYQNFLWEFIWSS